MAESAREASRAFGIDGSEHEMHLLETTRQYLAAIEQSTDVQNPQPEGALAFYHKDVRQEELPNRLIPNGAVRDFNALGEAASRGRGVLRSQRYYVRTATVQANRVVLETTWVGVLAVPFGSLKAGDEMRAHFAMFIEYDGDKIVAQRNYDCFEPF